MNAVLVDTSVWVDHFQRHNETLVDLLSLDLALSHPMVVAELACGTPPAPRLRTLADIALLRQARQASLTEVRELVEREKLYGLGCGLVDLALRDLHFADTRFTVMDAGQAAGYALHRHPYARLTSDCTAMHQR